MDVVLSSDYTTLTVRSKDLPVLAIHRRVCGDTTKLPWLSGHFVSLCNLAEMHRHVSTGSSLLYLVVCNIADPAVISSNLGMRQTGLSTRAVHSSI